MADGVTGRFMRVSRRVFPYLLGKAGRKRPHIGRIDEMEGPRISKAQRSGGGERGSSNLQSVLELAQSIDLLLRRPLLLCGRIGKVLLGVLDIAGDAIGAQFIDGNGRLGEDDQPGRADIGKAAADKEPR